MIWVLVMKRDREG